MDDDENKRRTRVYDSVKLTSFGSTIREWADVFLVLVVVTAAGPEGVCADMVFGNLSRED